jgi:hypothetical protein
LNFSHFPVVEEGVYIGSISPRYRNFEDSKKVRLHILRKFYTKRCIWLEVLEVLQKSFNLIPF